MILGFFFIRPVPLLPHKKTAHDEYNIVPEGAQAARDGPESARLLDEDNAEEEEEDEEPSSPPVFIGEAGVAPEHRRRERDVEMSPQIRFGGRELEANHDRNADRSLSRGAAITHDTLPNVYGLKLWKSSDFHLLFSILSLCECHSCFCRAVGLGTNVSLCFAVSGTGLMCMSSIRLFYFRRGTGLLN